MGAVDPAQQAEFAAEVERQLLPLLPAVLARAGVDSPAAPALAADLARFCAALADANERINLTGIRDPRGMALRHVLDALLALPALGDGAPVVDLGSGCGVPGIPLALALPSRPVVLIESRVHKAAALARLVVDLGLAPRVQALHARGEEWMDGHPRATIVTRAIGTIEEQVKLLTGVAERSARVIMLKGPGAAEELAAAAPRLQRQRWPAPTITTAVLPEDAGQRTILVFRWI